MISTVEKMLYLSRSDIFNQLSDEDLASVAQLADNVSFDAGTCFIKQGDVGNCIYFIIEGKVDIVADGVGHLATRGERTVLGEMSLLTNRTRTVNCIAATEITALKIIREDFMDLIYEKPGIARSIISVLVDRLNEAYGRKNRIEI